MQELFSFIHAGKLKRAPIDDVLNLVGNALDTLAEDDPRYPQLAKIEEELLDGVLPLRRLETFANKFGPDPLDLLETELRQCAQKLSAEQWQTPIYSRLEAVLASDPREFVERQQPIFQAALEEFEADVEGEETAELVGQRLLLEGIRGWLQVLRDLQIAASSAVLAQAERANRLLVTVAQLEQRFPELLT